MLLVAFFKGEELLCRALSLFFSWNYIKHYIQKKKKAYFKALHGTFKVKPWDWHRFQSGSTDSNSENNLHQHSPKAASCPINAYQINFCGSVSWKSEMHRQMKTKRLGLLLTLPTQQQAKACLKPPQLFCGQQQGSGEKASAADSEFLGKDAVRSHASCNNFPLAQEITGFLSALVAKVQSN